MSYSSTFIRILLAAWLPATAVLAQTGGSVGIGTTAPTQMLDVNGSLLVRGYRAVSNQGAYLQWNRTGGDGATWLLNQRGLSGGAIVFGSVTTADVLTEWARFDGNGRFGIGTATPQHPLVVQAASNNRLLGFSDSGGTDKYNFSRQSAAGSGSSAVAAGLNLSESDVAGGRLFVQDGTGNVGLGTTNPGQKLEVAGTIYSNAGGFRFPDNTVQTTAAVTATSANFIQNTTTQQASSNFNISGTGAIANKLGVGTASPTHRLHVATETFADGLLVSSTSQPISVSLDNGTGQVDLGVAKTASQYDVNAAAGDAVLRSGSNHNLLLTAQGTGDVLLATQGSGQVGVGTASPASSAVLDVTSTTQGLLLPRLTTTQMNAIASPLPGLMIFNTTANKFYGYSTGTTAGSLGQGSVASHNYANYASPCGQSFTAVANGTLTSITVSIYNLASAAATQNLILNVYASTQPTGTALATVTQAVSIPAQSLQTITFSLPANGVPASTNQQMSFVVTTNNSNLGFLIVDTDAYSGGQLYEFSRFNASSDMQFTVNYLLGNWVQISQ